MPWVEILNLLFWATPSILQLLLGFSSIFCRDCEGTQILELLVPFKLVLLVAFGMSLLVLLGAIEWQEVNIGGFTEEDDWYNDDSDGDSVEVWNMENE